MKILHLEDNLADAELVRVLLRQEWPACEIALRATRADFVSGLRTGRYDLILSDFSLPGFDGMDALQLVREMTPDTPFIFLSGTIGEERAIEALRHGAADYVLKDRMQRLPAAINRALREAGQHRARRMAEQTLAASETLLRQLIVHTPAAIAMFDTAMRYLHVSQRWRTDFHLGDQDLTGRSHYDIFPYLPERWKAAHKRALAGTTERCEEDSLVLPDGSVRWTRWEVQPWRSADGAVGGVIVFTENITERKRMQEQFLRAQRLENLGQLAAGVAHDLNNILSPVLMAAPLLRLHATRPEDLRMLDAVEKSAERGGALVQQILSFARGRGSEKILLQPKHVLREVAELVTDTFPKTIRPEIEIPADLWTIQANPTQLHQAVLNLCINARDAMPGGGTLTLRARNESITTAAPDRPAGPYLCLEISDTGTGIPAEMLPRIWEPFFTTKGEGQGTGLGLATVRGIVTEHRGAIELESTPGFGTTFRVWLPAAGEPADPAGPPHSLHPFPVIGHGELILVIDDDTAVRELVSQSLSGAGFRVLSAGDGAAMLQQHLARLPEASLVLMDLDLPDQDGLALARILQRARPEQRVLFMTGYTGPAGFSPHVLPPGAPVLKKPFSGAALLRAIESALGAPPFAL